MLIEDFGVQKILNRHHLESPNPGCSTGKAWLSGSREEIQSISPVDGEIVGILPVIEQRAREPSPEAYVHAAYGVQLVVVGSIRHTDVG